MKQHTKHVLALTLGGIALVALAATAGAVITNQINKQPDEIIKPVTKSEKITWNDPAPKPAPQKVAARKCDDGNVVGYGLGALGGGLIGSQLGDGKGKDVATIGGAAVGALAGGQYIPTRGVLCPK